ncbi:nucleolar MIF4G domain-containing protein 1 [Trichinella spiralis]|uniref:nucleolar MIF4G domain-containing protein 1 n=1 Tax=Trichinella spiralis TaxID=6334 RepID=UPI0001EFC25D|nr:nucleolar MIF4G domain-containing protein 1 [Trichinella spiralis]
MDASRGGITSFYDSLRQIGKLEKEGGMDGEGWDILSFFFPLFIWITSTRLFCLYCCTVDGGKYFFFISSSTSHQGSDLIIIITTIPILILEQHCRQLLLLVYIG